MNNESSVHKRESMSDKSDGDTGRHLNDDTTTNLDNDHDQQKVDKLPFNKTFVLLCTHFNAVLYSLCFWIQLGVLPVGFCISVMSYLRFRGLKKSILL